MAQAQAGLSKSRHATLHSRSLIAW